MLDIYIFLMHLQFYSWRKRCYFLNFLVVRKKNKSDACLSCDIIGM